MSRPISITSAVTVNTANFSGMSSNVTSGTSYPPNNGIGSSASTNYALFSATSTSTGYAYYNFSEISIPETAQINSVSCTVRTRTSATSSGTSYFQLMAGSTAKGSQTTVTSTTVTAYTLSSGNSWNAQEINNGIALRIGVKRASNNRAYSNRFYGATLTINYSVNKIEYEITSTLSTDAVDSISPAGLTNVVEGNSYELTINASDINDFKVTDNNVDVTSLLVQHTSQSGQYSFTGIPVSFDNTNSVYSRTAGDNGNGVYSSYTTTSGLTDHNSSTRCALYSVQGSGSISYMYYNFDCSSIPNNATITSVSCQFKGGTQGTTYYSAYIAQLCAGTTAKGSSVSVTGSNTSPTTVTINGGSSWTRQELNNIKIKFQVTRGSSNTDTDSTFSFYGATLTVSYSVEPENPYYWTYALTNVNNDHTIIISDSIIEIPEEDPQYEYYPITISSINATTTPGRGTTRVVEGTNQTIEIYPSDPLITLITDNGVDVSNQLVAHNAGSPTYTVTTQVNGASYGFPYNSSTGYYTSNNSGVSSSAAVCRVNFNLPVRCLVTIKYINYGEATYDFGVFSKIDTALSTTGWTSSSNAGDSTTDAGLEQIRLNTSAANTQTEQTLTYEIPSGEHFIDVKYGKDQSSNTSPDNLRFKIDSIQELEPTNYYTYTLSNVQSAHSLIFIFGDVTYYFVNSSGTNAKLYPSGSFVELPGDSYSLTIVPDDYDYEVTITDNNVDTTSSLVREEKEITKNGETYTVVNYTYTLTNVQDTHNLSISALPSQLVYVKTSGHFTIVNKVWKKEGNTWTEVDDPSELFDANTIYINKQGEL